MDELMQILEEGVETLHDGEIYLMRFDSGNRNYEVVGYDFDQMAKAILKLYNKYCRDSKYTLKQLATCEDEFMFRCFKIKVGEAFDDDEERTLNNYIGNYFRITIESNKCFSFFRKLSKFSLITIYY